MQIVGQKPTVCILAERQVHQLTYHLTVVRDIPLDVQTKVIGRYWTPEEAEDAPDNSPDFLGVDRDESHEDCIEDKGARPRGRRPRRPTEGVETK